MLVYFDNRHADPIVRFIQRVIVKKGMVPTESEADGIAVLVKGIEQEKRSVPYQIWKRNQPSVAPSPAPAARRASVKTRKKLAGGRHGE